MHVLVLGATGFLGSWTVRALVARNIRTSALVRPAADAWRVDTVPGLTVVRRDVGEWAAAIDRLRPDVVVSLDWEGVGGLHRDDEEQWRNLERQHAVIAASGAAGVRRFVGVGSQAEYGPVAGRIPEATAANPVTAYGRAKVAAMDASRAACEERGLEWCWVRVFSTFGALDNPGWVLPRVADALVAGKSIELSSGEQAWSYLPGSDAGEALAVLATHPQASGLFNLGHPSAPRLRATIERFAQTLVSRGIGTSDLLEFGRIPLADDAVRHLEPDVSRLAALGWRPGEIEGALDAAAAWFVGDTVSDPVLGGALPVRPGVASHHV